MDRYADFLPLTARTPRLTLGEGATPLVRTCNLAADLGIDALSQVRGAEPHRLVQGPRHDRAVAKPTGGRKVVICASTGNTAASAAAYAARRRAGGLIPQGKVAAGKLAGALAYGAR